MGFKAKFWPRWNKLRFYLSFLLLAFYLTLGIMLIFTDEWQSMLPKGRILFGIMLILFGMLRFYVSYRRYINKRIRMSMKAKPQQEPPTEQQTTKQHE